jgi:hypothetical protein
MKLRKLLPYHSFASPKTTDLLILDAVERKDEKSLKRVQKREQVCHRDRLLVEVQKAEGPRQSQQKHQHYGTLQPGPENSKSVKQHSRKITSPSVVIQIHAELTN